MKDVHWVRWEGLDPRVYWGTTHSLSSWNCLCSGPDNLMYSWRRRVQEAIRIRTQDSFGGSEHRTVLEERVQEAIRIWTQDSSMNLDCGLSLSIGSGIQSSPPDSVNIFPHFNFFPFYFLFTRTFRYLYKCMFTSVIHVSSVVFSWRRPFGWNVLSVCNCYSYCSR